MLMGYELLQKGTIALCKAEMNGFLIDRGRLESTKAKLGERVNTLANRVWSKKIGEKWKSKYGKEASLDSGPQLGDMLFNVMKLEPTKTTKAGRASVDKESLGDIDHPLCHAVMAYRKWNKVLTTYVGSIEREMNDDGILRPNFDLHTTKSFRSSSSNPNQQNVPVRDPEVGVILRKLYKARPGRRLIEIDYGAQEVRVGDCIHGDKVMQDYLLKDNCMHTDMALVLFSIPKEEVTKKLRTLTKGAFVFALFYGSYWETVAPAIWKEINKTEYLTASGIPLMNWLKQKNIGTLQTFTEHVKRAEDVLWNKRFTGYRDWKREFYADYQKRGWFSSPTGFRFHGPYDKNQVTNIPIQGSAFHCLLWAFIKTQDEIEQRGMKALLIGQIHDSLIGDVPEDEFDQYVDMVTDISTNRISEEWKWLTIPLKVEVEASPVNGTWFEKEVVCQE